MPAPTTRTFIGPLPGLTWATVQVPRRVDVEGVVARADGAKGIMRSTIMKLFFRMVSPPRHVNDAVVVVDRRQILAPR